MKVKDFPNWRVVIFNDRALLRSDAKYLSKDQWNILEETEVALEEDNGQTLVAENR